MKTGSGGKGLVSVFMALCLALFSLPSEAEVCQRQLPPLDGKWHEYRQDEFILQYALTGEHALQRPVDTQSSGVPDVVADAATQLVAMREMLKHLGFQLPLQSQRYVKQGASHILVRFRRLEGLNGRAFDEVRRLPTGECVLIIEVASHYRSGNLTLAHELFHQVQNGYTLFKRPWFYEGTARWAETILGKTSVVARPPPESEADRKALWAQSYAAVSTWYGLIERCAKQSGTVVVPDHVGLLRYRNGSSVIQDAEVPGYNFIRRVLERLGRLSDRVTLESRLQSHRWPEKMQRDSAHDDAMWSVVRESCGPV